MKNLGQAIGHLYRRLVQTARLACGLPDYDTYRAHMRLHHPDQPVMDYATFFRERQDARYGGKGGGRCCRTRRAWRAGRGITKSAPTARAGHGRIDGVE